jgi:hypothetical protein
MKLIMQNLKVLLIAVAILSSNLIHSQQSIVFEKTYRTETDDTVIMALTGAQTSDGGYLLGGYAAYGMYLAQMMFFKIDSVGNYQWKKMYGSLPCSSNMIYDMEPVGDGTFICCGEGTFSTEGEPGDLKPNNTMIMRVDENANILWYKEFDTGVMEHLREIAVSDTGYICVGSTATDDKYTDNLLWITGDFDGIYSNTNILNYGYMSQHFRGVTKMSDGNFVIGGHNWRNSFIFKVNPVGDTLQSIVLGSGYPEQLVVFDIGFTNRILLCGSYTQDHIIDDYYTSFYSTCDNDFENIETIFYEPENEVQYSYSQKMLIQNDNSFLIIGSMRTSDRGVDFWLKKHDSNGQLLWKRSIGGNDYESLRDVIKTNDGGYLVVAESSSFNDYTSMYIIKIDSLGQGNYTNPVEMFPKINNELVVFPNPANDKVCIEILDNDKNYTIEIYDINGKQIFNQTSFVNQNFIDVTSWENGMYLIRVNNKNATYQSKLIINH